MTLKKLKKIGNIMFWLTIFSPIISFALDCKIGEVEIFGIGGMTRYSWIMFLFMPFGILSIIIGVALKKHNQKYKKNFIVAFISLTWLILASPIFHHSVNYDVDKVTSIGNNINIKLPNELKVASLSYGEYDLTYAKIIDENSKVKFEEEIKKNYLWKDDLSSDIKSLLPYQLQYEIGSFDYFVFYNASTKEYNTFPKSSSAECVFVSYALKNQRLMLIDNYTVNLN